MTQLPLGIKEIPQFETTSGYIFSTLSEAVRHEVVESLTGLLDDKSNIHINDCDFAAKVLVENWTQVAELLQTLRDFQE